MRKREGFTLIELLVVMAIMAILLGIVRPSLTASASKSREFECQSHLKQIGLAVQAYVQDWASFPARLADVDALLQDRSLLRCPGTSASYYYHAPGKNASRDDVIAACIDPTRPLSRWPHRQHSSYLALTAGGAVNIVRKR